MNSKTKKRKGNRERKGKKESWDISLSFSICEFIKSLMVIPSGQDGLQKEMIRAKGNKGKKRKGQDKTK